MIRFLLLHGTYRVDLLSMLVSLAGSCILLNQGVLLFNQDGDPYIHCRDENENRSVELMID